MSSLYFSWIAFIFGCSLRIAAIDWNCFCAIGNMIARTMKVRPMIATPKLPRVWNSHSNRSKIGIMNQWNQPQSIAKLNWGMPALS